MSEILQNIDAVLGIAMSVMALLGFGRYWGRGSVAAAPVARAQSQVAVRGGRSGIGRVFRIGVLLAVFGVGALLTANWFAGDRGLRGRGDGWRTNWGGDHSGGRPGGRDRNAERRWR